jgi:hypothetical protein
MAARELSALWQKVREVAAPCRRVFARAMALCLGCVENRLDPAAHSRGGFRLHLPEGRKDGQNRRCVDFIDGTAAQRRGEFRERRAPLRPMLFVAPFAFLRGNERICDGPKCRNSRLSSRGSASRFDRVLSRFDHLTGVTRLVSRLGERHRVRRSKPRFRDFATEGETVDPFSGGARGNNEVKPRAVAIASGLRSAAARADSFCFPPAMVAAKSYDWSYNPTRIMADNRGRGKTGLARKP